MKHLHPASVAEIGDHGGNETYTVGGSTVVLGQTA